MGTSVYPPASGGTTTKTLKQKVFNSSGTWTYPTSSKFDGTVEITCVGGGGASGTVLNRSGSQYNYVVGGGGGGQVILRRQLSVLDAGNQTVTIGAGGSAFYQTGGLFGHPSLFGSGYIRNLYPDPALTKGLWQWNTSIGVITYPETRNNASGPEIASPYLWVSGSNPPQPPVGKTYVVLNLNSNATVYSQYISVKASTSYRIIFSHSFNSSGGVVVQPQILWYNESGENISSTSLTSFTTQSSSGTWTAVSSTVTSAAGAFYARIAWNASSAANYLLTGIQVAETAANVTSVVYGGSSGYAWTGVPDGSYTVEENERLIVAQGGGGGWGVTHRVSSSGSVYAFPGHAGYTAGGLGANNSSTSMQTGEVLISGSGGGAGGNAKSWETWTQLASASSYTLNTNGVQSSKFGFGSTTTMLESTWHGGIHTAAAYVGSDSAWYSTGTSNFPFTNFGENGIGIEGYGYGGVGAAKSSDNTYMNYFKASGVSQPTLLGGYIYQDYSATSNTLRAQYKGRDNTGNGANGWNAAISSGSTTDYNGARGGSGIVIVRWHE